MDEVLGIDEAGRGPVLGPMVIAVVRWNETIIGKAKRKDIPIEDCKKLTPDTRVVVDNFLRENLVYRIGAIPAWTLSAPDETIPQIEAKVIENILGTLSGTKVFSDALGSGNKAHRWLENAWPDRHFTFESGADDRYEWVSAASILAKVARDRAVEHLKSDWGELGSGYPSDPVTRDWLENWNDDEAGWPPFVRTKWSTVSQLESSIRR